MVDVCLRPSRVGEEPLPRTGFAAVSCPVAWSRVRCLRVWGEIKHNSNGFAAQHTPGVPELVASSLKCKAFSLLLASGGENQRGENTVR